MITGNTIPAAGKVTTSFYNTSDLEALKNALRHEIANGKREIIIRILEEKIIQLEKGSRIYAKKHELHAYHRTSKS